MNCSVTKSHKKIAVCVAHKKRWGCGGSVDKISGDSPLTILVQHRRNGFGSRLFIPENGLKLNDHVLTIRDSG